MHEYNFGAPQGWQCPICKRVYSPTMPMCYSCGNQQTITADNATNPTINDEGNKHYINVLLSVEGPIDADELTLIRNDLESEISCCWHFFDIKDVMLVSPSMQVLTLKDLIALTNGGSINDRN